MSDEYVDPREEFEEQAHKPPPDLDAAVASGAKAVEDSRAMLAAVL